MIKNLIKILLVTVFLVISVPMHAFAELDSESDLSESGLNEEVKITTTSVVDPEQTSTVSSTDISCENIGSANEGWYKGTALMLLDDCEGTSAICNFEGTRDEGWYNIDTEELIVLDQCSEIKTDDESDMNDDESDMNDDESDMNDDESDMNDNESDMEGETDNESDMEDENKEISDTDTEILSNTFGAEMRLLQLKKRVEFQIESGELIVERINNANKSENFNMEKINEIILGFENIIVSIDNFDFTLNANEMAEEYVALKKEAIDLTKQFREEIKNGLSDEDKKELREAIKKNNLDRKAIKDKKIEELKAKYNAKKTKEILERIGTNHPELIAKIESGEVSIEEIRKEISLKYNDLDEEKKAKAKAKLEEEKKKFQIKAEERRAELKAKTEERQAELKAKLEERRAELKAKAEERRAELKAKAEERRAELKAKTEERQAELKAKAEERQAELKAKAEERRAELEAKAEERRAELEAKDDESKEDDESEEDEEPTSVQR